MAPPSGQRVSSWYSGLSVATVECQERVCVIERRPTSSWARGRRPGARRPRGRSRRGTERRALTHPALHQHRTRVTVPRSRRRSPRCPHCPDPRVGWRGGSRWRVFPESGGEGAWSGGLARSVATMPDSPGSRRQRPNEGPVRPCRCACPPLRA
jgi:hypothetical protein